MTDLATAFRQAPQPATRPASPWSRPGVTEAATTMFRTGASLADISDALWVQFQVSVSASSVGNVMHRAGIKRTEEGGAVARERIAAASSARAQEARRASESVDQAAPPPVREEPEESCQRRRPAPPARDMMPGGLVVLALRYQQCRWPIGDPREPGFRFCESRQCDPDSRLNRYCAEHADGAFLRAEARKVR